MVPQFNNDMNRSMTEAQFCQVVDAILSGKYSWACLLILQFAGYNPLHYIPYRTYNRLMKENSGSKQESRWSHEDTQSETESASIIVDNLPHLHTLDKVTNQVRGGHGLFGCRNLHGIMRRWG